MSLHRPLVCQSACSSQHSSIFLCLLRIELPAFHCFTGRYLCSISLEAEVLLLLFQTSQLRAQLLGWLAGPLSSGRSFTS